MIEIDFDRDIWEKCPHTIQNLSKDSIIYRYHYQRFKSLLLDRALPSLNYLHEQIRLDTAENEHLNYIGEEYGVIRYFGETDYYYRERITLMKIIKSQGLNRAAIKLYLRFKTGYSVEILDEYEFAHRNNQAKPTVITKSTGCWSRAYILFYNVPPLDVNLLYSTLREIVEPYQKISLVSYTGIDTIKKIISLYCDNYIVIDYKQGKQIYPDVKSIGSVIHSTYNSIAAYPNQNKGNRPSRSRQIIGIQLHANPSISIEELEKTLAERLPVYEFHIKFANMAIMLDNYVSSWSDITTEYETQKSLIWPSNSKKGKIIQLDTQARIDTPILQHKLRCAFGVRVYIKDQLYSSMLELSKKFKIVWGCEIGLYIHPRNNTRSKPLPLKLSGYLSTPYIAKSVIYIFLYEDIDIKAAKATLTIILPEKDFRFRRLTQ